MKLILVLLTGLTLLWTRGAECSREAVNGIFKYPIVHVTIKNVLSDSSEARVHCKSGDDDIGEQVLGASGIYEFRFRPNIIIMNTLFFCSVSTHFGTLQFEVYDEQRDVESRCTSRCRWEVEDGGVVGFHQAAFTIDKRFPWKS